MQDWGFIRVTAASPPTRVADPLANAQSVLRMLERHRTSSVIVCGELTLSGYTCGELFGQAVLLRACLQALEQVALATAATGQLVAVGLPLQVGNGLYNVAAVLADGRVVAVVPKQFLPNSQEFYEARWFTPAGEGLPSTVDLGPLGRVPFGIDLLMARDRLMIGIELCEDLWMPMPPSSWQATAGAHLILNLSASNELIGKADWRQTLVRSQSGRCLAAYAYASAGPGESSTDLVFGGHCLIAENGTLLAESVRVGASGGQAVEQTEATADIDLQRLEHDRRQTVSWLAAAGRLHRDFRVVRLAGREISPADGRLRPVSRHPFVPDDPGSLHERCAEIFGIQTAALAKRIDRLPPQAGLHIGVSGGLDSTLALLVAVKTCQQRGLSTRRVVGLTMPGFGTSSRTLQAARTLLRELDIESREIDIRQLCLDTFRGLGHAPFGIALEGLSLSEFESQLAELPPERRHDLVFENVQARVRTLLLMNCGFVLGTGDLSEQALGWSTYNGDHMSMYNVNTSIPKTLVRFLIQYLAQHHFQEPVRGCLLDIVAMPISPELLPAASDGDIVQKTEEAIGSYELHDFFLYHLVRFGTEPRKLLHLARLAGFEDSYAMVEIRQTLAVFLRRFFANQFKRSCVPDGPKVGSVSLSPRGDWRMPSDAEVTAWLAELDTDGVA